jgi:hypothetical protein
MRKSKIRLLYRPYIKEKDVLRREVEKFKRYRYFVGR